MHTIAFPPARRRRRLVWGGALFLAFDALLMAGALLVITQGRHAGLALAFATLGVAVSAVLAWVLTRPPHAEAGRGELRVHAAFRTLAIPLGALDLGAAEAVDLTRWPERSLPLPLTRRGRWRTGDALGWQVSAEGQRYFCAVTRIGPALLLPFGEGDAVLLATDEPDELLVSLRAAQLCATPPRASSAATAGRILPSRNSRKAPPPVEM